MHSQVLEDALRIFRLNNCGLCLETPHITDQAVLAQDYERGIALLAEHGKLYSLLVVDINSDDKLCITDLYLLGVYKRFDRNVQEVALDIRIHFKHHLSVDLGSTLADVVFSDKEVISKVALDCSTAGGLVRF